MPVPSSEASSAPARPWWRQPGVWVGFALSTLAVITLGSLFDLRQVGATLLHIKLVALIAAPTILLGTFFVRSLRWKLLLRPVAHVPFTQARDILMTGYMVNNLLPARLGELARAVLLGRAAGVTRRGTLASVGIERLCDGLVLIGILALLGLLFEVPPWTRHLGQVTALVVVGCGGLAAWLAFHHRSLLAVIAAVFFWLPRARRQRITGFIERFVDGTAALRSAGLISLVLLLSVLIWAMEAVIYVTMMWGLGIHLPAWAAALALVVANLGIAVPSAPGYVGIYEAACSGALIALGLEKEQALSYAIGVHLVLFVSVTGCGLLLMWRLGLKLREVTQRPAEVLNPGVPKRPGDPSLG